MITPLSMLGFPIEFRILSILYGGSVVAPHFYRIIKSRSKIEILEKIP